MAAAAVPVEAPLHRGLPDEISIWEILVRLPPKALLRCRAVCRAWRRATSSRGFLLAHHGHQPALPIFYKHDFDDEVRESLDILPLDHRAGAAAAADHLRPVARFGSHDNYMLLEASCDGLLLLATIAESSFSESKCFSVCNPATRQYAPLPLRPGFSLAGMYPHPPTGEYRLLLLLHDERPPGAQDACYVYALGSSHPPRHIGWPEEAEMIHTLLPVLFRGSLHWYLQPQGESSMVVVFDTTAELFRRMRAPAVPDPADLFEMDGMLGIASFNDAFKTIGIWTTQDYQGEVWAFRCQVELPVAEITVQFDIYSNLVVSSWDDNDVHILIQSGEWLLQIDIAGKLVARYHSKFLSPTQFCLKETLVQHAFFPAMEGYVVNIWPFISPDDYVQCGAAS